MSDIKSSNNSEMFKSILTKTKTLQTLSQPTKLPKLSHKTTSLKTNILIVGGSFSGLAVLRLLQTNLQEHFNQARLSSGASNDETTKRISITLVEPRNGLLNILGIPKSIVDTEFAKTQYLPFNKLNHVRFNNIVSSEKPEVYADKENGETWYVDDDAEEFPDVDVTFVQGTVTYLDDHKAEYVLNDMKDDTAEDSTATATATAASAANETGSIDFDYVVMASGRDRNWPTTPSANTMDEYLQDMNKSRSMVENANIISVVGAGAVGIEIAGDIKLRFPEKTVNLVHPHEVFPPEPLSLEFKRLIQDSIERAGVNIYLNTRINRTKSSDTGDLITTETGKTIPSEINFWCTAKHNNIAFLSPEIASKYVAHGQINVNEYLQLHSQVAQGQSTNTTLTTTTVPNFFVLGDLVNLPIIKSAGWAMYMGRQTANNITSLIFEDTLIEPLPDLKEMPRGMVLVGGQEEIVSELAGEVNLNHEGYKKEYLDYCIGKIRATLDA